MREDGGRCHLRAVLQNLYILMIGIYSRCKAGSASTECGVDKGQRANSDRGKYSSERIRLPCSTLARAKHLEKSIPQRPITSTQHYAPCVLIVSGLDCDRTASIQHSAALRTTGHLKNRATPQRPTSICEGSAQFIHLVMLHTIECDHKILEGQDLLPAVNHVMRQFHLAETV